MRTVLSFLLLLLCVGHFCLGATPKDSPVPEPGFVTDGERPPAPRNSFATTNSREMPENVPTIATTSAKESADGPLSPEAIFGRAAPAVVKIVVYDATGSVRGLGSGFFIGSGQIVTNAHVIANAYSGEIQGWVRTYSSITVLKKDTDLDLALLAVEDAGESVLLLSDQTSVQPGQRVIAVGNPLGLDRSMSDGLISAIRTLPGNTQLLQISAPLSPGSSGGPLLDMNGAVIGVASASMSDGQNLNFAVGVQALRRFLEQQDSPQRLHEAGTRVLWRVILKRVAQVVLLIVALAFGGGWFVIPIAIMILAAVVTVLARLGRIAARLFRRRTKSCDGNVLFDKMASQRSTGVRTVLRWLLVLPGALVVVGLLPIPLHLAVLGLTRAGGFIQIPPEDAAALERALTPLVAAFGFVFGGACIAPTRRVSTSILLSLLLVVLSQLAATSSVYVVFSTRVLIFQVVGAGLGILAIVLKCRADRPIAPA